MLLLSPSHSLSTPSHPFLVKHNLRSRFSLFLSLWVSLFFWYICMCEFVYACMSFPLQEFFIFFGLMLCCLLAIRDLTRTMLKHKKCSIRDKFQPCAFATSEPTSQNGFCRRDLVLFGLSSSFSLIFPTLGNLQREIRVSMGKWVDILI